MRVSHVQQLVNADGVHAEASQAVFVAASKDTIEASAPPNEVDGRACAHILDTKDVAEDAVVQDLDVEGGNFAPPTVLLDNSLHCILPDSAFVPLLVDEKTGDAGTTRSDLALVCELSDLGEVVPEGGHELLLAQSVEALDDAVVVHNLQVVTRVDDRHELVEVLLSSDGSAGSQSSLLSELANVVGCSAPVVAIGDVCLRDLLEFFFEEAVLPRAHLPELVAHRHVGLILILLDDAVWLTRLRQVLDLLLDGGVLP